MVQSNKKAQTTIICRLCFFEYGNVHGCYRMSARKDEGAYLSNMNCTKMRKNLKVNDK